MQQGKFNRNYLYGCIRTRCIIWKYFHSCNLSINFGYICMVIFRRSTQLSSRLERSGCVAASMSPETCSTWNGSTQITTFMGRFMGHLGEEQIVNSQAKQNWKRQWNRESCGDPFQGPDISWYPWILITLWHSSCGQAKHWHVQVARGTHPLGLNASETPFIYKFGL